MIFVVLQQNGTPIVAFEDEKQAEKYCKDPRHEGCTYFEIPFEKATDPQEERQKELQNVIDTARQMYEKTGTFSTEQQQVHHPFTSVERPRLPEKWGQAKMNEDAARFFGPARPYRGVYHSGTGIIGAPLKVGGFANESRESGFRNESRSAFSGSTPLPEFRESRGAFSSEPMKNSECCLAPRPSGAFGGVGIPGAFADSARRPGFVERAE